MRVLIITNMYPSETNPHYGSFIKSQVDSLAKLGVEIDILFIRGDKSPLNYLWAAFSLLLRIFTRQYDLVHAHYGLCGLVARLQWRYPVVVSFCGNDLLGSSGSNGRPTRSSLLLAWLHKRLALRVNKVIVKSKKMQDVLPGRRGVVIPNGVNFDLFKPLDQKKCRKRLGLGGKITYILFPYSTTRIRKNFGSVREAVDQLKDESDKPIEILVVEGVSNVEMPIYMNAADVLVLSSLWEGSPNAVKEALACNTKVVSTDVGDVSELIDNIPGCCLCKPIADDIADKLRSVLDLPLKTNSREQVSFLRIEKIANRVLEVYLQALNRLD